MGKPTTLAESQEVALLYVQLAIEAVEKKRVRFAHRTITIRDGMCDDYRQVTVEGKYFTARRSDMQPFAMEVEVHKISHWERGDGSPGDPWIIEWIVWQRKRYILKLRGREYTVAYYWAKEFSGKLKFADPVVGILNHESVEDHRWQFLARDINGKSGIVTRQYA